jgi:hypothetical protein
MMADMEEKWEATLQDKQEWLMKPETPAPGFNSPGLLELAVAAAEAEGKSIGVSNFSQTNEHAGSNGSSFENAPLH